MLHLTLHDKRQRVLGNCDESKKNNENQEFMQWHVPFHEENSVPGMVKCLEWTFLTGGHGFLVVNQ